MTPRERVRLTSPVVLATGLLGSALVAAGGSLHARLALTSGAQSLAALARASGAQPVGFAVVFVGLAMLTAAWVLLGRSVRGRPEGTAAAWGAAVLWAVPLLVAPPLFSNDAWSYVAEGDLVAQDRSPYVSTPLDLAGPIVHAVGPAWGDALAPYGPLPLIWGGLVSRLSTDPWFDLLGFRVLALVGLVMLGFAASRLARRTGHDPAVAVWLAVASPFTLTQGVGGAHLDLILAGFLGLAVLSALAGRWFLGAVLVGAATAIKVPAVVVDVAIVLGWICHTGDVAGRLVRRVHRAADVVAITLATVLGWGVVGGVGTGWLVGLRTPLRHLSPLSVTTEVAIHLGRFGGPGLVTPLREVGVVALALVVAWVLLCGPARTPEGVVRSAVIVTGATVLLAPVVHYWYVFWCLPFLSSADLHTRTRRMSVVLVGVLGLLAPVDFSAGHLPFSGQLVLLGLGLVGASAVDLRLLLGAHLRRLDAVGSSAPDRPSDGGPSP